MLLAPQHFQQMERSLRHMVQERFRASAAFEWGLLRLEVDRESLRNGRFALISARGVLPDGTPFSAPDQDPLPAPRALEGHFATKQQSMAVSLGLPSEQAGRPRVGDATGAGTSPRFSPETIDRADDLTGDDERSITVARPNLVILFPDDALGEYDSLQLAEVIRTADGGYALQESFVPPCLAIEASDTLLRQLRIEIEMLIAKSSELGERRRQRGRDVADFSSSETANFWLLNTVNAYIPALSHFVSVERTHPEQVYLALASLAGQLCTLSPELHPKDLPAYQHRGLGATFSGLHSVLTRLLETVISSKAVRIDLERKDGSIYVGRIQDPRLLEPGAGLYLGVQAEVEEQRLVTDLPGKMKIASLDKINFLIANALRGVPISFTRVPPASLPVKSNFVYFQLDSNCEAWEGIRGAKNLAIFAPPDYPGIALELLGLRE
jgi:type VI secretion system protein ImpJ